ncbi:MAG: hypothetical protein WD407_09970 [Rhodospirillales bacterium]
MGLSLTKIIFTVIVVFAAWKLFTWLRAKRRRQVKRPDSAAAIEPQDTEQCPVCKAYVPLGAGACERGDCPYAR